MTLTCDASSPSPENIITDWNDDLKMRAMFSSLPPSRDINPTVYDSKITYWSNVLNTIATHRAINHSQLVLNPKKLQSYLTRKGCTPLGLGRVVVMLSKVTVKLS
jgi:hypothetical protein